MFLVARPEGRDDGRQRNHGVQAWRGRSVTDGGVGAGGLRRDSGRKGRKSIGPRPEGSSKGSGLGVDQCRDGGKGCEKDKGPPEPGRKVEFWE